MVRIPTHTLDTAPADAHSDLAALQHRFGRVLNVHAGMAHAPVVLAAYSGVQTAIARQGTFDAAKQQAIALAVAAVNGCGYCQAAHTTGGQRAGWSLDQTIAIRAGEPVEPKLDALLSVARRAAAHVGHVDETTWTAALEVGWDTRQLAELFAHVAANMFTNYFTHYAGTEMDLPAAPELPCRQTQDL
jgi:AhpD family alkylhydroperoxidase